MRLLVTRPEPDAERTAAALRARGHAVIVAPLLRVETVADAELGAGPWAAVLLTSANAARAIAGHKRFAELRTLPVLAVGERSAQAMREAGFGDVSSADGAASDLTRLVAERLKRGVKLLHLAGEARSGDIAADLGVQNFRVSTVTLYRAVATEEFPPAAAATLASGVDGVLHFSRRSAKTYVRAAGHSGLLDAALKPIHYCLSAQVSEPLARAGAARIRVAREPTEAALLACVGAA